MVGTSGFSEALPHHSIIFFSKKNDHILHCEITAVQFTVAMHAYANKTAFKYLSHSEVNEIRQRVMWASLSSVTKMEVSSMYSSKRSMWKTFHLEALIQHQRVTVKHLFQIAKRFAPNCEGVVLLMKQLCE